MATGEHLSSSGGFESSAFGAEDGGMEVLANGLGVNTSEVEARVDDGNIQEAESSLRGGLSLNDEEARALLGRLEYQKGNVEAALRVFDGIDLQAAIHRLQPSLSEKPPSRRSRSRNESPHSIPQHAASLVLEAIYLKSLSLQKLGKLNEAARECKSVLDAVEKIFHNGIPDVLVDNKLQETVSKAVELLPELWKQTGCYQEALVAYRRSLLSQWNLDNDCCVRIQKRFAVFLLYSGVESSPHSLAAQIDGAFVPKNNLEEAILLLMILLRKFFLGKTEWDPAVMEHFTFAMSLCGKTSVLARHLEEVLPGIYHRCDRWNSLALCYSCAGQNEVALNLLRKSLNEHEKPDDFVALLLAAKICSEDCLLASEGAGYARRVIANAKEKDEHLKGAGLRFLGICLQKLAKAASSDHQRTLLLSDALKSLHEAINFESHNPDLIFELGLQYAEYRNTDVALRYAQQFIDVTGGSILKGWKLLALVLSAQRRYPEAEVAIESALDETAKWEKGPLLRIKAKLKEARSLSTEAVETYRSLYGLVHAQRKSFGSFRSNSQIENDKVNEFEVWHGLASLYSNLSRWKDAEICLEKAKALMPHSADTLHVEGVMLEARGQLDQALAAYKNGLSMDSKHIPCKVSLGSLLWRTGSMSLPAARSFLSDALSLEPTNRMAWYYQGMVHRDEDRMVDAADCFQAACMLEESDPIESFSSIT
ncbi:putative UDP-N-acetylglucosamine--peptide N-acetylglucosaminyltransferase SPINDLY [Acorus gramineus]|uniref:UDP-N-acetylglucosamine--peptide N-acetylglucosaminyltransferase SPINDLY n=1 Tax=Acorus gramineus TaxID=55184 RepID=A0AAV9BMG9_ACOGR|nr:putative UDP-N-acetylglucosamine--peptide N-acetylglucosaminyltransferase SPINDLY [Acorus gramineus]